MTIFHWVGSDFLRRYTTGDIIVEAPGLPEARHKVMAHFEQLVRDDYHLFWFLDAEEIDIERQKLKTELENNDPVEGEEVIMIWGSE